MIVITQPVRETVAITGIGAVTPLGHSFEAIAESLLAGRSGIRSIDPGEFSRESHQFAAAVDLIPAPPDGICPIDVEGFAGLTRLEQMVVSPVAHAISDAGLIQHRDRLRIGLVLGLGAEHLKMWELDFLSGGRQVLAPPHGDTLVHHVARMMNLRGPAVTVAAACASSGDVAILNFRL